jgi:pimeloyl-ACP methyl ester carboxylesterase
MLIFIHGMLSNADVWQPFITYFTKKKYSCTAVNLREGLDLTKTRFHDYVDKVKKLMREDDIVIGHSMGGLIVQKIAEETMIKGGVCICSASPKGIKFRGDIVLFSIKYAPKVILKKPFKEDYQFIRKYMLAGLKEDKAKAIYESLVEESAIVTYEIARNKIAVDEKKVTCPLLFIATKNDRVCPPGMVEKMAGKYNAEYQLYDGCHHFFSNSSWRDIAEGIHIFITKL